MTFAVTPPGWRAWVLAHPRKPLRWQFVFYSPVGADWKLLNLRFDDTVEQSLIPD